MNNPKKNSAAGVNDRQRAAQAVELRTQGRRWADIAAQLGYYDDAAALRAVNRALARAESAACDEYREVLTDRYDELYQRALDAFDAAASEASKSQLLNSARAALDSIARVHGLDKTATFVASSTVVVGADAIDREISGLAEKLRTKVRADADAAGMSATEITTPILDQLADPATIERTPR